MLARPRSRRAVRLAGVAVVAVLLAGGGLAAWHWVRQQYFVGVYGDQVAVFRGLPQDLGPIGLSSLDHTTDVMVSALPPADRDSVRAGLVVDSSAMAAEKVEALRQAAACASLPTSTPTAAPTPTPAPTSGPAPGLAAGPTVTAGPTTGATTGPSPGPGLSAGGGSATGTATLTPSATSVSVATSPPPAPGRNDEPAGGHPARRPEEVDHGTRDTRRPADPAQRGARPAAARRGSGRRRPTRSSA